MEVLIGMAGKFLWPILVALGGIAAWVINGMVKKRQGRMEERAATAAEGKERSLEAHREADRIKEEARDRERTSGGDPNKDYPGGVKPR